MKRTAFLLFLAILAATSPLISQSSNTPNNQPLAKTTKKTANKAEVRLKPFSAFAFGGGISAMGVNVQASTNLNRYLNLRGTGNYFNYTVNNITTNSSGGANGLSLTGKLNFATAGASLDLFPFPKHGFRLSPGVLLYNQNQISASATAAPKTSFTLNNTEYFADTVNPLNVNAFLGLSARQQAFTLTTGWGNMIPRNGGHWSFPFEIGAAFTGVPTLNMGLTGNACSTLADANSNGVSCVNMATNPTAQTNLANQLTTYRNDLKPLQVYPILSWGASYAFHNK